MLHTCWCIALSVWIQICIWIHLFVAFQKRKLFLFISSFLLSIWPVFVLKPSPWSLLPHPLLPSRSRTPPSQSLAFSPSADRHRSLLPPPHLLRLIIGCTAGRNPASLSGPLLSMCALAARSHRLVGTTCHPQPEASPNWTLPRAALCLSRVRLPRSDPHTKDHPRPIKDVAPRLNPFPKP
jgi:hypothetical protein